MLNYSIHGKHLLYPIRNVFFPFWKLNTSEESPIIKKFPESKIKGSETIILSRTDFLITTVKVITILGYLIISSHERLQPISTFLFSILSWVNFPVDWLKHKQFECDITYSSCFSNQSTCFCNFSDQSSNRSP